MFPYCFGSHVTLSPLHSGQPSVPKSKGAQKPSFQKAKGSENRSAETGQLAKLILIHAFFNQTNIETTVFAHSLCCRIHVHQETMHGPELAPHIDTYVLASSCSVSFSPSSASQTKETLDRPAVSRHCNHISSWGKQENCANLRAKQKETLAQNMVVVLFHGLNFSTKRWLEFGIRYPI